MHRAVGAVFGCASRLVEAVCACARGVTCLCPAGCVRVRRAASQPPPGSPRPAGGLGSSRLAASNSGSAASKLQSSHSATPAKLSSVGSRGSLSSEAKAPAATFASRGILRVRETFAPAASPPSRRLRVAHWRRWGSSIAGSSDSNLPYPARSPEVSSFWARAISTTAWATLPSALGFEGGAAIYRLGDRPGPSISERVGKLRPHSEPVKRLRPEQTIRCAPKTSEIAAIGQRSMVGGSVEDSHSAPRKRSQDGNDRKRGR